MKKKKKKVVKRKVAKNKEAAKKKAVKKKRPPKRKAPPPKQTKYTARTAAVVETLIGCGMNLQMVCKTLGITPKTLWNWRKDHAELETAIEEGRVKRADRGEDVLFDMCEPHDEVSVKEKDLIAYLDKDGEPVEKKDRDGSEMVAEVLERETTTKKGVVSERLLLKMLEANKPEKYGKKAEHTHKFTFGDLAKMALGDDE